MKIALLTSSRADYSIYLPLIKAILREGWELEIVAFGTHLSERHGLTYKDIESDGFIVTHKFITLVDGDSPRDIAKSMALTVEVFSDLWSRHNFDLIFALGDRFEMFAAVAAAMPFNLKVAHIAGGETTLGAIDNAFRHSISHMSSLHFVVAETYANRLETILGTSRGIVNTGSLSLENFKNLSLFSREEFCEKNSLDERIPYVLITIHPETVAYEKNIQHMDELITALEQVKDMQLLVTMPNSDTMGNLIRGKWSEFAKVNNSVHLVESLGSIGYLSAMQHCEFMLGNTSSGYVEASMFPKWVINLGVRQYGRIITNNISCVPFVASEIIKAIHSVPTDKIIPKIDIYGNGTASQLIVAAVKDYCSSGK
jgi:GDP/UDP-N,N'-diacetylbacillosamine 2-epimerase (hydrolysing)